MANEPTREELQQKQATLKAFVAEVGRINRNGDTTLDAQELLTFILDQHQAQHKGEKDPFKQIRDDVAAIDEYRRIQAQWSKDGATTGLTAQMVGEASEADTAARESLSVLLSKEPNRIASLIRTSGTDAAAADERARREAEDRALAERDAARSRAEQDKTFGMMRAAIPGAVQEASRQEGGDLVGDIGRTIKETGGTGQRQTPEAASTAQQQAAMIGAILPKVEAAAAAAPIKPIIVTAPHQPALPKEITDDPDYAAGQAMMKQLVGRLNKDAQGTQGTLSQALGNHMATVAEETRKAAQPAAAPSMGDALSDAAKKDIRSMQGALASLKVEDIGIADLKTALSSRQRTAEREGPQ